MVTLDAPPLRTPSTGGVQEAPAYPPGRQGAHRERPRVRADWVAFAPIALFPLWWALGLAGFVFQLAALAMVGQWIVRRPRLVWPWPAPLWAGLVLLIPASMLGLDDTGRIIGAAWRASTFLGVGVWFLWVYNHATPTMVRRLVRWIAVFWAGCALLGFAALALPDLDFASPLEQLVPASLLSNSLVFDLVHPRMSQVQDFIGFPLPRPAAPFPYSNSWGSAITIFAPVVVLALSWAKPLWRRLGAVLAVASLVPLVVSANRTAWATLVVGLSYVAVRLARRGRTRLFAVLFFGGLVAGAVVLATPLADLVVERFANPHSNDARLSIYTQVVQRVAESPLLGFGAPLPNTNPNLPSLGTQGSFWLVLFSHGVPAMLLFVGFWGSCLLQSLRVRDDLGIWGSAALLIATVQIFFYDLIPTQLFVITVVAAVLVRRADDERDERLRARVAADPLGARWLRNSGRS